MREGEKLVIIERSHIGKVRRTNQDYIQHFKSKNGKKLILVCDGMGGHNAGDVASEMAAVHFGYDWENETINEEDMVNWILHQLKKENERILNKSKQFSGLEGMGTTMVGATELTDGWLVFNIGDSRGYLFSNFSLTQLTRDHSFVNELVRRGEITREEAVRHPKKNIVTRSLGVDNEAEADFFEVEAHPRDVLLLCTDGLTNMVSDDEIEAILSQDNDLDSKANKLLEEALDAGGTDNISFIMIQKEMEGGNID